MSKQRRRKPRRPDVRRQATAFYEALSRTAWRERKRRERKPSDHARTYSHVLTDGPIRMFSMQPFLGAVPLRDSKDTPGASTWCRQEAHGSYLPMTGFVMAIDVTASRPPTTRRNEMKSALELRSQKAYELMRLEFEKALKVGANPATMAENVMTN